MTSGSRVSAWLAVAVAAAMLLAALPGALARDHDPGFGRIVDEIDDAEREISTSGAPDEFRYRDSDSSGSLQSDEAVFLTAGSTVEPGDVRIANTFTRSPFTVVRSGDADDEFDVDALDGTLRYFDTDRSGIYSQGDTVYYDLDRSNSNRVSVSDVILTGPDAGELVTSGHDEIGFGLSDFPATPDFGYYDEDDDNTRDLDEGAIIDIDDDGLITVGDVRLGDLPGGDGGEIVTAEDRDVSYVLEDPPGTWDVQFRDPNGDGDFDLTEPVYFTKGDRVATFAVRLANPPDGFAPGSKVVEQHFDWNIPTEDLSGSLAFIDIEGDGDFDDDDTLYYDLSGSDDGRVSRGDLILSGSDAGEVVSGGADYMGDELENFDGDILYFDVDGNDFYDSADLLYADNENDDLIQLFDVQLSLGAPDTPERDQDDDGIPDNEDDCPREPGPSSNDGCPIDDADDDGVADDEDNCPNDPNADQADLDEDGTGDACDDDRDGDGVADEQDNCPADVNPDQADADEDGTGDACDAFTDSDGDGIEDERDNCPEDANPDQADLDADGTGDACDETDDRPDADGDGTVDAEDLCPEEAGPATNDGCPVDPGDGDGSDDGTDGDDGDDGDADGADGNDSDAPERDLPAPGSLFAVIAGVMTALAGRRRR